jgi:hypothetical protein
VASTRDPEKLTRQRGGVTLMESNSTMTSGAVDTTCTHARVWRDRLQPGTRLLADHVLTLPGTTLPTSGKAVIVGQVAVAEAPIFATAVPTTSFTYMDVPPFRTGRPPV